MLMETISDMIRLFIMITEIGSSPLKPPAAETSGLEESVPVTIFPEMTGME